MSCCHLCETLCIYFSRFETNQSRRVAFWTDDHKYAMKETNGKSVKINGFVRRQQFSQCLIIAVGFYREYKSREKKNNNPCVKGQVRA